MREFKIDVPQSQLDDLKQRLAATRWPDEMPGVGWSRGAPLSYIKELAEYWRTSFDWRAAEARMNQFPHFLTEIDGVQVHFLHARSPEPNAMPLIITHGWPGSFVEFLDVIDPLINPTAHGGDPADAFHVIIPSVPGYGFSGPTHHLGWDTERVALAWKELMRRLGYTRYIAQGGDWGSPISLRVGLADPEHVAGVHINMCVTLPPPDPAAMAQLMSEMTESSLMLASSSVFCSRWIWRLHSRTNCLRVRNRLRISWVCVFGTKLARIRPCANSSASHIASLMSVLRPGTFFTCAAFANTNTNSPSSKMCHTGFQ